MSKEEALKVLKGHQEWRTGNDEVKQTNHKELTKALRVAIDFLKESNEEFVSSLIKCKG